MYVDKLLMFSENQTVAAGTSTNTLDGGATGNAYDERFLVVTLTNPLTPAQGLSVVVESCDTATGTYVKAATFEAAKEKGMALAQRMPYGLKQFVRLSYVVSGAPTGNLTAVIAADAKI